MCKRDSTLLPSLRVVVFLQGSITHTEAEDVVTVEIARQFGHSRTTVRHALVHAEPHRALDRGTVRLPSLGQERPRQQRHTAAQVFRRIRDEHGYAGGYAQVQRHLRKHRRRHEEGVHPLGHLPGQRLEADFGHIHIDFPDGRRLVPFWSRPGPTRTPRSSCRCPSSAPKRSSKALVAAFEFFGAVPKEVWWDNPRTVATLILMGRRQLQPRYAAFASHYVFEPRFCMPARGNEKPDAEGAVKAVQKRFATPVPRVADLDELNAFLRKRCEAERDRVVQSLFGPFTIKDRLAEDLAAATPTPAHRFDPCVIRQAVAVDKYQTVTFDGNRLASVPPAVRIRMVTVKGYVAKVVIIARPGRRHPRTIVGEARDDPRPDPLPGDAEESPARSTTPPVFRDWKLPAASPRPRAELQRLHGGMSGSTAVRSGSCNRWASTR